MHEQHNTVADWNKCGGSGSLMIHFPAPWGGSNEIDLASLRALGSWGFISLLFGSVGSSLLANSSAGFTV